MATLTETLQTTYSGLHDAQDQFEGQLRSLLLRVRGVDSQTLPLPARQNPGDTIPNILSRYTDALNQAGKSGEAEALQQVHEKVVDKTSFGGLGLDGVKPASAQQHAEATFLIEAWLEAINSRERAKDYLSCVTSPAAGTRPMTLAQKIFAQHVVGEKPVHGLAAGDVVRVGVDWILASELSWAVRYLQFRSSPA